MKKILARFWAAWGAISFLITFLFIFPISLFSFLITDKFSSQLFFGKVSRVWMSIWLPLIGCRLQIRGKNVFDSKKNYIIVFNHNALLDVPLSSPFVPGANKTIAKISFSKIPLFGLFYSKGSILVDRSDEKSRIKSYEEMKKVLSENMHVCIYPEGTRNKTNQLLKPFYDGAFKLAIETKKDIIPCIISGTKEAMPIKKKFYLWPTKLSLHFLPPVSAENFTAKELNKKVFDIMYAELSNRTSNS